MMYIVYHIQSGAANTILYLRRNIEEKYFMKKKRLEVGEILRKLCELKGVNIMDAEICIDHVYRLVEIPPKMSISSFMGYLKGKMLLMEKEILELLKNMDIRLSAIEKGQNEIKDEINLINKKLDGVVEQTADLLEFRITVKAKLDELKEVEEVTKVNCYDIAKLKAVK